ncbi:MAG: SLBB domain-containing protein [Bacilli bacterium]|nr:SLBB domain-containing protein [Bacilli bacterium]
MQVKAVTNREVKPGGIPSGVGANVVSTRTAYAIYQACYEGKPVIERIVTVAGSAMKEPVNALARVGTPFQFLAEQCGGFVKQPRKINLGGPMMGASVSDDTGITTRTVTSLIVDYKEEYVEQPCIRCGSCVLSCPMDLRPVDIMLAMKVSPVDKDRVKALKPLNCMECGLCTYSCTSKIKLLDYIRRAKPFAKLP